MRFAIAAAGAAALLLAAAAPPARGDAPAAKVLSFDEALATFRTLCVEPLPSPERFVAAMNASGIGWRTVRKSEGEVFGTGNSWRSEIGQVTYHNPPYADITGFGPACHLEWRVSADYDHRRAATALAAALSLPPGEETGKAAEPQTKWEAPRPDGLNVRYFLSTAQPGPEGRTARLS